MVSLRKIDIPYLSAALFAIVALVLSFLVGFLSGIRWNVVLLRTLILTAVFAGIGFGVMFVLRKFIPELYEMMTAAISRPGEAAEADLDTAEEGAPRDSVAGGEDHASMPDPDAPPESFRELDGEKLAHYTTASQGGSPVDTRAGKLGKHVLQAEKLGRYEPKIMAQAVRTMMSRDRE